MFFKKDKSIKMSLPETKELHGIKIAKLPVARYINALNTIENLPNVIVKSVVPEVGGLNELVKQLQNADANIFETIIVKLLQTVPKEFCILLSELLGIPEKRLLDADCDNPLSLNDLLEIIIEFWEVNDMNDFFVNVRKLEEKLTAPTTTANTGCKDGLQSPKA